MQATRFTRGGYVAHKLRVRHVSPMVFSAWFTDAGVLIDAEGRDCTGKTRPASQRAKAALEKQFPSVKAMVGL